MYSEKHIRNYRFQAVIFLPSVDLWACGLMQTIGKYIQCVPIFSQYSVHKPIESQCLQPTGDDEGDCTVA